MAKTIRTSIISPNKSIDAVKNDYLGVPACFAAQSACYGLRYRFGADALC